MKPFFNYFTLMLILSTTFFMTGCSKDNDENTSPIVGMWHILEEDDGMWINDNYEVWTFNADGSFVAKAWDNGTPYDGANGSYVFEDNSLNIKSEDTYYGKVEFTSSNNITYTFQDFRNGKLSEKIEILHLTRITEISPIRDDEE